MSEAQPVGDLLDSLGVKHSPNEGEIISDAVVLMKVIDADGRVSLRTAWSDGMSWIERIGMLRAAERAQLPPEGDNWDDD